MRCVRVSSGQNFILYKTVVKPYLHIGVWSDGEVEILTRDYATIDEYRDIMTDYQLYQILKKYNIKR